MNTTTHTTHNRSEPSILGDHDGFEIYPMPAFLRVETTDVAAATSFYTDRLGMEMPS